MAGRRPAHPAPARARASLPVASIASIRASVSARCSSSSRAISACIRSDDLRSATGGPRHSPSASRRRRTAWAASFACRACLALGRERLEALEVPARPGRPGRGNRSGASPAARHRERDGVARRGPRWRARRCPAGSHPRASRPAGRSGSPRWHAGATARGGHGPCLRRSRSVPRVRRHGADPGSGTPSVHWTTPPFAIRSERRNAAFER